MPRQTPNNQTRVRCGGPGDALDAIPWMLGFVPTESLVMLGLCGPRLQFGPVLRLDLHDPEIDEVIIAELLEIIVGRNVCDQVILVVYTDRGSSDPLALLPRQALLQAASTRFEAVGIGVRDAVVARHGRWWSLLCDDPLCCAPEGTAIAHEIPSAIELAYRSAGVIPPMPSREALVDSLRLRPAAAVEVELGRLAALGPGFQSGSLETQLRDIVGRDLGRRGAQPLEPAVIALLIFLVQHVAVRDAATELPYAGELAAAVALWREVYVATPEHYRPQVGAVLAVLAWEAGASALAACACESVLALDPGHKLSRLTLSLVGSGIRPDPRLSRPGAPHPDRPRSPGRGRRR